MKKSERLNDMMMFLNNKNSFNIKDIMERYHISRSSAIRDIKSLEELGMPIYSKSGRNGSYKILPNRLLSPIVFTIDEVLPCNYVRKWGAMLLRDFTIGTNKTLLLIILFTMAITYSK